MGNYSVYGSAYISVANEAQEPKEQYLDDIRGGLDWQPAHTDRADHRHQELDSRRIQTAQDTQDCGDIREYYSHETGYCNKDSRAYNILFLWELVSIEGELKQLIAEGVVVHGHRHKQDHHYRELSDHQEGVRGVVPWERPV